MTKAYYVTRHLKIGNVKGEMYNSEVKAFAQFAELDGKSQAVAVWDELVDGAIDANVKWNQLHEAYKYAPY